MMRTIRTQWDGKGDEVSLATAVMPSGAPSKVRHEFAVGNRPQDLLRRGVQPRPLTFGVANVDETQAQAMRDVWSLREQWLNLSPVLQAKLSLVEAVKEGVIGVDATREQRVTVNDEYSPETGELDLKAADGGSSSAAVPAAAAAAKPTDVAVAVAVPPAS